jgi:hypothetical protein
LGELLVGLPVDNPLETDLKTLDFNIALKPTFGWSSILYPYPGTEISVVAAKRGMLNMNAEKAQVSNKSSSILDFGDEKIKRKIVNLHKLFGIIVQFPFLRPLTGFLISLPLTTIYTWVFFAFYGYKYIIRRTKLRNLAIILWQFIPFYFKYVLNLERKKSIKNKKSLSYPQK